MIILSYGLPQKHESQDIWLSLLPQSFSVSSYWPGNLKCPGPYDLLAIATVLMKIGGIKVPGKISDNSMPFWDLTLRDNELFGTPRESYQQLSEEAMVVINELWTKRKTHKIQTVIVDKLNHWYVRMLRAMSTTAEPTVNKARADLLATETLYWLSKSATVILESHADWVDADRSTRVPASPAELIVLADVTLFVHDGILVESVRKSPLFLLDLPEGKMIEQRLLFKSLGILAETEVEKV